MRTRPLRSASRCAGCLLLFATSAVLVTAQDRTFRSGTNTVSAYVTVVDKSGRPVTDLAVSDFEVFDNHKRQSVTIFENGRQPITIVMMLDRSGSMVGKFNLVRDAAGQLVQNLLPTDRARIGSFSNRVQIDPVSFTSDHDELFRILREDLQGPGDTPLWNATASAMNALDAQPGRRVVLVFTDGKNSPGQSGVDANFKQVRDRARAEEIMIYAIGLDGGCGPMALPPSDLGQAQYQGRGRPGRGGRTPRGPIGGRGLPRPGIPGIGGRPPTTLPRIPGSARRVPAACDTDPDPDLRELADEVGGSYFVLRSTDDLGQTFARVADELHQQYLLGFTPQALDGKTHRLDVRVRRPDLTVRARKNYVAAKK